MEEIKAILMVTSEDFDSVLEKSLRETLEEIGGQSVRDSVMYYLSEKYHVRIERMSSNPKALVNALSEIFGVGESLVEKKLIRKLTSNYKLTNTAGSLEDIIKRAKLEEG